MNDGESWRECVSSCPKNAFPNEDGKCTRDSNEKSALSLFTSSVH